MKFDADFDSVAFNSFFPSKKALSLFTPVCHQDLLISLYLQNFFIIRIIKKNPLAAHKIHQTKGPKKTWQHGKHAEMWVRGDGWQA